MAKIPYLATVPGDQAMNLLSPTGSRASFLRVVATVHMLIAILIVGGISWIDPTWVWRWFNTYSGSGYTPGQRALLFLTLGSGGLHNIVALSAVLVLV
ncbi:MAG: hypothetical protein ACK51T_04965, partial [bacterium]